VSSETEANWLQKQHMLQAPKSAFIFKGLKGCGESGWPQDKAGGTLNSQASGRCFICLLFFLTFFFRTIMAHLKKNQELQKRVHIFESKFTLSCGVSRNWPHTPSWLESGSLEKHWSLQKLARFPLGSTRGQHLAQSWASASTRLPGP
jgi:hypothetical protein